MKYELKKLNCPSCGATIDVDIKDRDTVFCSYCGTQIAIDDGETVVTHLDLYAVGYDEVKLDYASKLDEMIFSDDKIAM